MQTTEFSPTFTRGWEMGVKVNSKKDPAFAEVKFIAEFLGIAIFFLSLFILLFI